MGILYFDNAGNTRLDSDVLSRMMPYMTENYGNPSSVYSLGRKAKADIEDARDDISLLLGCGSDEIIFTSGGSESDSMALLGIARENISKGKHILVSSIEHSAVLKSCEQLKKEGFEVTYIPVSENGVADTEFIKRNIRKDTVLVSVMYCNNETGVIQPVREISDIAHSNNSYYHCDATGAGVFIPDNFILFVNADAVSFSGHNIYAPKGTGLLYIKKGIPIQKLIFGGHQEREKRGGTENVAGIIGLCSALKKAFETRETERDRIINLRNYFENAIKERISDIVINGELSDRIPFISSISFNGVDSRKILINLDMNNICVSTGSACASGSVEKSHVINAMYNDEIQINNTIRFSFGRFNTREETDILIEKLTEAIFRLKNLKKR